MTLSEITVSRTERHKCTNICPNILNDNINGAIRNNKTQKLTGKILRKNSELLTIPEIFRKIYCSYSTSEAGEHTKINTVR